MPRSFTPARALLFEERIESALAALLSSLKDAAADAWTGAALGGALARGEGFTPARPEDPLGATDPLEIAAVVDVPLRELAGVDRRLSRALERTARSRRVEANVRALARASLPLLPATVENLELLAAARVVDGPPDLLAPARTADEAPGAMEALRLLVRSGGRLLAAEMALEKHPGSRAAERALLAVETADLSCGAAVLVSARRFAPSEEARGDALRALGAGGDDAPRGFQTKMTWTRFHDLVEAHRAALRSRLHAAEVPPLGELRQRLARAADRWLEVLRLSEEERLGRELGSWSAHARALASRVARSAALFGADEDALPTRREVKRWTAAERGAPALGALLDWDPHDLPVAPVLLDLPDDAPKETLRARAAALAAEA
ncbi:MAG TPA: hypothetical protein VKF32_01415 [Thermoanaerobaculia bacterium]|nr:hypothetical protein [Thermoanaerobaculia bacterium]